MPVSRSSMKTRYSLTLSVTGHDARMAIGMSKVVSRTRNRLMPSTPTKYSIPKAGIHGMRSRNCIAPLPASKPPRIFTDKRKWMPLASSATANSACLLRVGNSASSTAPKTGMASNKLKFPIANADMITIDRRSTPGAPVCRAESRPRNAGHCPSAGRARPN